jgi:hypothetical protein
MVPPMISSAAAHRPTVARESGGHDHWWLVFHGLCQRYGRRRLDALDSATGGLRAHLAGISPTILLIASSMGHLMKPGTQRGILSLYGHCRHQDRRVKY